MTEKSASKMAFLIDCIGGINILSSPPRILEDFPVNSDIFLFYPNNHSRMHHRLKRLTSSNHGIHLIPTSENAISINIAFKLGQVSDEYSDLIIITAYDSGYEDVCQRLIERNGHFENHIQFRCFDRLNDFIQFLHAMTSSPNKYQNEPITMNYSAENLFHFCPFETKEQSTYLYRLGQLLHHLDTDHAHVQYEYCTECKDSMKNRSVVNSDTFEKHIQDKHWENQQGFQLTIWPAK